MRINPRNAVAIAISALALGVGSVGGPVLAQAPTTGTSPTSSPATADCPGSTMGPGMMGGPGSTTGPGMMGGPGSTTGPGMGPGMMGDPGSTTGPGMMGGAPAPSAAPPASQRPSSPPMGARIEVTLSDDLRMHPCAFSGRAGEPITFIVTNRGAIPHELFLGDEAAQIAHEQEMLSMGGAMLHDEPDGVAVAPGETKELTWTFMSPGQYLAGCHVPGHYPAGMKASITVTP